MIPIQAAIAAVSDLEQQAVSSLRATVAADTRTKPISRIKSSVNHSVSMDGTTYSQTLTVASAGNVNPFTPGSTAIYGDQSGLLLRNKGSINGGGQPYSGDINGVTGGTAVDFTAPATLVNAGSITGGQGEGAQLRSGAGGAGVVAADLVLSNSGTIEGGEGGNTVIGYGGAGGTGVVLSNSVATNSGVIRGGAGGGYYASAVGGTGVDLSGGTLVNSGSIQGGNGGNGNDGGSGSNGGTGIFIDGGTLITSGTISGGLGEPGTYFGGRNGDAVRFGSASGTLVVKPGAIFNGNVVANVDANDVLVLSGHAAATLSGFGTDFTGFSQLAVDAGAHWTLSGDDDVAAGVSLDGGALVIDQGAAVSPLARVIPNLSAPAVTGVLIGVTGSKLLNSGSIDGGAGAYYGGHGGTGLIVSAASVVGNSGTITGGVGGLSPRLGGDGGVGIQLSFGQMTNNGVVTGGAGGQGPQGGDGAVGVVLTGGVFVNAEGAQVAAGVGGLGDTGGDGGIGLTINGATLVNAGTVSAGGAGPGYQLSGQAGNAAVTFGSTSGTLIIDPGAVFNGQVIADTSAADLLELSGVGIGTITGLGSQYTGFGTILEDQSSNWVLVGSNTVSQQTTILVDGGFNVAGNLKDLGTIGIGSTGTFQVSGSGAASVGGLALFGGTLATSSRLVVGRSSLPDASSAGVLIKDGYGISGFGTITGSPGSVIRDNGFITALSGTLIVDQAVHGSGALILNSGANLMANAAISVKNIAFNNTTQDSATFTTSGPVTGVFSNFADGDTIDLRSFLADSFSFQNGKLALQSEDSSQTRSLIFSGNYTAENFGLTPDQNGGTFLNFIPTNSESLSADWQLELGQTLSAVTHHIGQSPSFAAAELRHIGPDARSNLLAEHAPVAGILWHPI